MKKTYFLLLVLFFGSNLANGQATSSFHRLTIRNFFEPSTADFYQNISNAPEGLQATGIQPIFLSQIQAIPLKSEPFLAYSVVINAVEWSESVEIYIRFSENGKEWTLPEKVEIDQHSPNTRVRKISRLEFTDSKMRFFRFRIQSHNPDFNLKSLEFHFHNPSQSVDNQSVTPYNLEKMGSTCPCPQPNFQGRSDWCPQGTCPPNPNPNFTNVTHLIVHHSDGANSSSDWAAIVRAIWSYHVNTNGWADIGYNWLIDPNGVIYEGRGHQVTGAHFCGTNINTVGVCLLGNFNSVTPTPTSFNALKILTAWELCEAGGLNPLDSSNHNGSGLFLSHISGHRNGCATDCPGNQFYTLLPQLRQDVEAYISNNCSNLNAPTNLTSSINPDSYIELNWVDNSTTEDSFIIERSLLNFNLLEPFAAVESDVTNYLDTAVVFNIPIIYRVKAKNAVFQSDYTNTTYQVILGTHTDNSLIINKLSVYPNPTKDFLYLETVEHPEFNPHSDLQLVNSNGQVQSLEIQGVSPTWRLPLSHLPDGMYFLILNFKNQKSTLKILKE